MSGSAAAWSDTDDILCPLCHDFFGFDLAASDRSTLPVRSRECDHCICHGCLGVQHSMLVAAGRPTARHVPCPVCNEPKAFDAQDPRPCRKTCRIVTHFLEEPHSGNQETKSVAVKQEHGDELQDNSNEGLSIFGEEESGRAAVAVTNKRQIKVEENQDRKQKAKSSNRDETSPHATNSDAVETTVQTDYTPPPTVSPTMPEPSETKTPGKPIGVARGRKRQVESTDDRNLKKKAKSNHRPGKSTDVKNSHRVKAKGQSSGTGPAVVSPIKQEATLPVESGTISLTDLLHEKKMKPSRDYDNAGVWIGKGPRNERELLRFYSDGVGLIQAKKKRWEWDAADPELVKVRAILDKYKKGTRAPQRKHWNDLKRAKRNGSPGWSVYSL